MPILLFALVAALLWLRPKKQPEAPITDPAKPDIRIEGVTTKTNTAPDPQEQIGLFDFLSGVRESTDGIKTIKAYATQVPRPWGRAVYPVQRIIYVDRSPGWDPRNTTGPAFQPAWQMSFELWQYLTGLKEG